jgi:predicted AlkP superfamily pyrophosphatase or phosphodiesterase
LTTVSSGSTPSEHGIVSSVWEASDGKKVNAYSSEGQSVISNFADTLSQISDGQSLIISLSGDEKLASSMCPHVITMSQHPFWNNFCFFWNSKKNFVEPLSVQMDNTFLFVQDNLLQRFSQQILPSQFVVEKDFETKTVRIIKNSETTVFSLENKDDLLFFVELEMIKLLGNKIEKLSSFANDEHTDFYGLGISSLKNFKKQSNKFQTAVEIIDAFIVDLAIKLDRTYQSKFISQLVFLGSDSHAENIATLESKFSTSDDEELFQGTDYEVHYIPEHHRLWKRSYANYYSPTNQTNNGTNGTVTYYTANQVAIFHMCLWTPIVIAIILIVFICSMYGIDAGDSIVMRASHAKVN